MAHEHRLEQLQFVACYLQVMFGSELLGFGDLVEWDDWREMGTTGMTGMMVLQRLGRGSGIVVDGLDVKEWKRRR